jgi:hypothetical protein
MIMQNIEGGNGDMVGKPITDATPDDSPPGSAAQHPGMMYQFVPMAARQTTRNPHPAHFHLMKNHVGKSAVNRQPELPQYVLPSPDPKNETLYFG